MALVGVGLAGIAFAFDGPWASTLAHAHAAVTKAAQHLTEDGSSAIRAREVLEASLEDAPEPSSTGGVTRWVTYADPGVVSAALLSTTEDLRGMGLEHEGELDSHHPAVVSFICSPADGVCAYAALDGGAFMRRGDETSCWQSGEPASAKANVLHLPKRWCTELDAMVTHLSEMGLGMPVDVVRKRGAGRCEGLLEVLLARADVHVAPPSHILPAQDYPPPQVLCAFDLLLREGGGRLSDVYGEPIELLAEMGAPLYSSSGAGAVQSAVPLRGLMATEDAMAPYFARASRAAFPAAKGEIDAYLDLLRLHDKTKLAAVKTKIVGLDGRELVSPKPNPNQPRL